MNVVYMLRCGDGSLYTGWTNDLPHRLAMHRSGRGGKYTRAHQPVELAYFEAQPTKRDAMRRETEIKALPRKEKLALCERFKQDGSDGQGLPSEKTETSL